MYAAMELGVGIILSKGANGGRQAATTAIETSTSVHNTGGVEGPSLC